MLCFTSCRNFLRLLNVQLANDAKEQQRHVAYCLRLEYWYEDFAHHALEAFNNVSVGAVHPHERHFRCDVFHCYFTAVAGFEKKQAKSVQTLPTTTTATTV